MNGRQLFAYNIQVSGFPATDPEDQSGFVYPTYFEVAGIRYRYLVYTWSVETKNSPSTGEFLCLASSHNTRRFPASQDL